jgi:hypothetical protein
VPSKLGILALAISVGCSAGCAPVVDGPIERQRAIDRDDGDRLAAQLARLPGVAAASVVLRRAMRDPLGAAPPVSPMLAAVLTIERSGSAGPRSNAQRGGESIERSGSAGPRSNAQRGGESIERSGSAGPRSNAQRGGESTDDAAEPEAIRAAATRLARAALPELPPADLAIEIAARVHRPIVAKVGPFSVEESSRTALRATLALAFASIAGLGGALALRAWRHRLGRSAQ